MTTNELRTLLATSLLASFQDSGIPQFPKLENESNQDYKIRVLASNATTGVKATVCVWTGSNFTQLKSLLPSANSGQLIREFQRSILELGFEYNSRANVEYVDNVARLNVPIGAVRTMRTANVIHVMQFKQDTSKVNSIMVECDSSKQFAVRIECNPNWKIADIIAICNSNASNADLSALENSDNSNDNRAERLISKARSAYKSYLAKTAKKQKAIASQEPATTENPVEEAAKLETPKSKKSA